MKAPKIQNSAKFYCGISAQSHDASVTIVQDGRVLFSAEEERFDRIKHSDEFPLLALQRGLHDLGLNNKILLDQEIINFSYFFYPWSELWGNLVHVAKFFPESLHLLESKSTGAKMSYAERWLRHKGVAELIKQALQLPSRPRVNFYNHHLCHAASAFYASPYEEAAILTIDGRGEAETCAMFVAKDRRIKKLRSIYVPHSLGHFYAAMTWFLGFKPFTDEWKVMGMAAYGKDTSLLRDLLDLGAPGVVLNLSYLRFHVCGQSQWFSKKFYERFGPPRSHQEPLEQRHFDLAASLQFIIEESVLKLARELAEISDSQNLCMAGGVAYNVLANARLAQEGPFKNVYIQPVAGDSGASMGAALLSYYQSLSAVRVRAMELPFAGTEYTAEDYEKIINASGYRFEKSENICAEVAQLLNEGAVVGWFQGKMEMGPRALGNRSILAHPGIKDMKEILNAKIKRRESFRPFAPSVLKHRAQEYFEMPKNNDSPYMILSGRVLPHKITSLPAITHVDGSARVHTVDHHMNSKFATLLEEFDRRSGIPILLNTSFNENEPIVENPQQALECFSRTQMDALAIGDYLLRRDSQRS